MTEETEQETNPQVHSANVSDAIIKEQAEKYISQEFQRREEENRIRQALRDRPIETQEAMIDHFRVKRLEGNNFEKPPGEFVNEFVAKLPAILGESTKQPNRETLNINRKPESGHTSNSDANLSELEKMEQYLNGLEEKVKSKDKLLKNIRMDYMPSFDNDNYLLNILKAAFLNYKEHKEQV